MSNFINTVIAAALVNNLVFVQLVGVSSLFAYSRRFEAATELAWLSFLVMFPTLALAATIERFVLTPLNLGFLALLTFVVIAATLAHVLLDLVERHFPLLARRHRIAILLLSSNSAIVGAALLNSESPMTFPLLLASTFGSALGFSLLLIAFAALRQRYELADVPAAMKGPAIDLLCAGIAAMCFLGFAGVA